MWKLDDIYSTDSVTNTTSEISIPIFMITTKRDLNFPEEVQRYGYNNKYQFDDINQLRVIVLQKLQFLSIDRVIMNLGQKRLERVKMSIENNNYSIPLIGLSWDSKKVWD